MEHKSNVTAEHDGLPHLLLAGRELELAAMRVAFMDVVAGRPKQPDLVWTVSSDSGRAVLRDGLLQVEPLADECEGTRDA